jgi:hypothetical protein
MLVKVTFCIDHAWNDDSVCQLSLLLFDWHLVQYEQKLFFYPAGVPKGSVRVHVRRYGTPIHQTPLGRDY